MRIPGLDLDFAPLPAPLPIWRAAVSAEQWRAAARAVRESGGRLVALWGSDRRPTGFAACAAYALLDGLAWLDLALPADDPRCPDLAAVFPAAARMQRASADLLGIAAEGAADTRPWLDHGTWPLSAPPLRRDTPDADGPPAGLPADYAFV